MHHPLASANRLRFGRYSKFETQFAVGLPTQRLRGEWLDEAVQAIVVPEKPGTRVPNNVWNVKVELTRIVLLPWLNMPVNGSLV